MSDQPVVIDETQVLRNAQANLIAIQYQRIALLEARVTALVKQNTSLQSDIDNLKAEIQKLPEAARLAEKVQVQA